MSESDTASVECPLCGETFDPTAAGGWCTNSGCGEWQYEADVTPDQQTEPETAESPADAASGDAGSESASEEVEDAPPSETPSWVTDDDAAADAGPDDAGHADTDDADDTGHADDADVETEATADEQGSETVDERDAATDEQATAEVEESDEGGAEQAGEAAEQTAEAEEGAAVGNESAAEADGASATTDGDEAAADEPSETATSAPGSEPTDDGDEGTTIDCPGCGSGLDADVNFCPDCGEDVSDLPAEPDGDELGACPACGVDVDADDSFCVSCGEDLDAHRGGADVLDACPDCGVDVDEDDSFCAGCGADLDAHRSGAATDTGGDSGAAADNACATGSSEPAPDALALSAYGRSVVVADDDVVGREIRSLLTEAGRPEEDAVRVHREHVRFVREADQFYVVALGQNPTLVNGTSLVKGDREPVGPGDEIELSDVVTLAVEAA